MKIILATILPTLLGLTIMLNGQILKTDDIIASAWTAHHQINQHEIRTALELYYSDHNQYPQTTDTDELFKTLYEKNYISRLPVKPESYSYKSIPENDSYEFLTVKQ